MRPLIKVEYLVLCGIFILAHFLKFVNIFLKICKAGNKSCLLNVKIWVDFCFRAAKNLPRAFA